MQKEKIFRMWELLKYLAISIIVVVLFTMVSEAYDIKLAVTWVEEKVTKLVWNNTEKGAHHYRIEVTKTNLLQEPVTSYISYAYTQDDSVKIELDDDCAFSFRVQAVDESGSLSSYSEQSPLYIYKKPAESKAELKTVMESDEKPQEFSLSQNFPNPFNSQTTIKYFIPNSMSAGDKVKIELVIYNSLGQKVRTIINGSFPPGNYMQIWDGKNDSGQGVSSGHYIYQLTAGSSRVSKKMVFLK